MCTHWVIVLALFLDTFLALLRLIVHTMLSVYHCLFQVAERQGRYLAKALSYEPTKDSPEPKPFVFKSQGMLAYIGDYRALADTPIAKSQGTA